MKYDADITSAYAHLTGLIASPDVSELLAAARDVSFLHGSSRRTTKDAEKHYRLIRKLIRQTGIQHLEDLALGPIMSPTSLDTALEWCFYVAAIGSKTISEFIKKRKEFGKCLLHAEYAKARSVLEEIREVTGWSLYYIEKRLLLENAQHGSHAAKAWLDHLSANLKQPGISILAHVYKIRAGSLFNRWSFDAHLESIFNVSDSDLTPLTRNEFVFLVDGATLYFSRDDLASIASCISRFSFIDIYLMTLKVARLAIFSRCLSKHELTHLSECLKNIKTLIKDEHLETLCAVINETGDDTGITGNEAAFLELQGCYLSGDFEAATAIGSDLLNQDPLNAYVYDILAKSIVHRGSGDHSWKLMGSCLAYRIVDSLAVLYSEKGSSSLAIADLESISIALGDNHLGYFIRSICQKYQGLSFADDYLRFGFLNHRNRTNVVVFESSARRFQVFQRKRKNASHWEELAIDFSVALHESCERSLDGLREKLHPMIFAISAARLYADRKDWYNVLDVTRIIRLPIQKSHDSRWFRQLAVHRLQALLALGEFDEAKELFAICYCRLNNFIRSFNLEELCMLLESLSTKSDFDVELLTIRALRAEDYHERAVALRDLIKSNRIPSKLPSALIEAKGWEKNELAALVFTRLFPAEVLKYARLPRCGGTNRYEEALNEYLKICICFLPVEDPLAKRDICLSMIGSYAEMRERLVWEAVAGPRIVVRVEKLRGDLQPIIESQFRDISKLDLRAKKDVVERCFDIIRSEFVFNKRYGLTSSLGTKIRHGFFYNAFFDALEGSGLAGRKRVDGNDDWAAPDLGELGVFSGDSHVVHKLKKCLQELSSQFVGRVKKFRDSTIALISADSLREDRGDGPEVSEFKFDSFESEIARAAITLESSGTKFFDWATDQLMSRLQENLHVIRGRISKDLQDDLNVIVTRFEMTLRDLNLANQHKQSLAARAKELQTELRGVCSRVSQWFEIVDDATFDCAAIGDVFNVIAKDAAASNRIVPRIDLSIDLVGSWSEVDVWYHVFSILFENAGSASASIGRRLDVMLFAMQGQGGKVILGCRNQLGDANEALAACQRIKNVVADAQSRRNYGPKESGVSRAIDLLEELPRLAENIHWYSEENEVVVQFAMFQSDESSSS